MKNSWFFEKYFKNWQTSNKIDKEDKEKTQISNI